MFEYEFLYGNEIEKRITELAELRIKVFQDYPYLYEGEMTSERKYLQNYGQAKISLAVLVFYKQQCIGETRAIWLAEEVESLKKPLSKSGLNPENYLYFSESLVLPEFRKQGLGTKFFQFRLDHFRKLKSEGYPLKACCFCSVEREENHRARPKDYKSLDSFWLRMGFVPSNIRSSFAWKDVREKKETTKQMTYYFNE